MNENLYWKTFLLPYELAVGGFLIKLESLRKAFILKRVYNPIEIVSGRVKTVSSILEKADRLGINHNDIAEKIYDIAGIRITCKYIQDVYQVYELLKTRKDIDIFMVKDYINNPKENGYRSLHIIAKYQVETVDGQFPINMEFQIRTHAMHLWASIEHTLQYKYYRQIPEEIKERLYQASLITAKLDDEMANIKEVMNQIDAENTRNEDMELEDFDFFLNNIKW
ncbi:MAG: GTP pyrophosphokinase family protein [Acholeplasmataceae bacterium]|nr:GTP pyrophosphokinase family protein [Acholeplasmataceae bacterium]